MNNASHEFEAMKAAEAAFEADAMSTEKLAALEVAERAYFAAENKARDQWAAVEASGDRDSADLNASETVVENGYAEADRLAWYRFAIGSLNR